VKEYTVEKAENSNFNPDVIDFYNLVVDEQGQQYAKIVEATLKDLGDMGLGTSCGNCNPQNTCFVNLAKKFPRIKVRAAIDLKNKITGSIELYLTDIKLGYAIEKETDSAGGSLRYEHIESPGWAHFETE
jgi:hypothetical protein